MQDNKMISLALILLKIFCWFLGVLYIFGGLFGGSSISLLNRVVSVLAGLVMTPLFWEQLKKKLNINLHWGFKVFIYLFLIIVAGTMSGSQVNKNLDVELADKSQSDQPSTDTNSVIITPTVSAVTNATPPPTLIPTDTPTITFVPTDTPSPTSIPKRFTSDGFPTDGIVVSVENLDKAPNKYLNKNVIFTCIASIFIKDEKGNPSHFNCHEVGDFSKAVLITSVLDSTEINDGDKIKIYGIAEGSMNGTNAYGASVVKTVIFPIFLKNITTGYEL